MTQLRLTNGELARFRMAIRRMSTRSRTYEMLREELTARGNWKNAPRGKPSIANFNGSSSESKTERWIVDD